MPDEVTYTHGHAEQRPALAPLAHRRELRGYLLARLAPGLDLLDVGCGPGTITADLAERVAPGRVVGLDVPRTCSTQAARTAAEAGPATSSFAPATCYALPFADDSFDVVHAHQVLQHLADPVAALREMAPRAAGPAASWPSATATTGHGLVPGEPGPGAVAGAVPPGRPLERRRARCRPPPRGLGACGRPHRRAPHGVGVVLRRRGGAGVVVRPVGRADRGHPLRRRRRGPRLQHPRRARRPSRPRGASGVGSPTAGSPCCTASCWRRSADHVEEVEDLGERRGVLREEGVAAFVDAQLGVRDARRDGLAVRRRRDAVVAAARDERRARDRGRAGRTRRGGCARSSCSASPRSCSAVLAAARRVRHHLGEAAVAGVRRRATRA